MVPGSSQDQGRPERGPSPRRLPRGFLKGSPSISSLRRRPAPPAAHWVYRVDRRRRTGPGSGPWCTKGSVGVRLAFPWGAQEERRPSTRLGRGTSLPPTRALPSRGERGSAGLDPDPGTPGRDLYIAVHCLKGLFGPPSEGITRHGGASTGQAERRYSPSAPKPSFGLPEPAVPHLRKGFRPPPRNVSGPRARWSTYARSALRSRIHLRRPA
jgi:hypothetical protein